MAKTKMSAKERRKLCNTDMTIVRYIYRRLKIFKKHLCGYPDQDYCKSEKQWAKNVGDMIFWAKAYLDKDCGEVPQKKLKRFNKGYELFCKNLSSLWI